MFALYEIDDPDGEVWTTEALRNPGGQQPGLSHLSFYVSPGARAGDGDPPAHRGACPGYTAYPNQYDARGG